MCMKTRDLESRGNYNESQDIVLISAKGWVCNNNSYMKEDVRNEQPKPEQILKTCFRAEARREPPARQ